MRLNAMNAGYQLVIKADVYARNAVQRGGHRSQQILPRVAERMKQRKLGACQNDGLPGAGKHKA